MSALAVTALALTGVTATGAHAASVTEPTGTPGSYTNTDVQVELAEGTGARGTIALLPDIQFYSRYGVEGGNLYADQYGPDIPNPFTSQTTWITENSEKYGIGMTMHLGDVVDQDRENRRVVASAAISVLEDANVPFSLIPGNHDVTDGYLGLWPTGGEGLWTNYLSTFPAERLSQAPSNLETSPSGAGSYHLFEVAGVTMANVALADQSDFEWADEIIKENPTVPTIVTLHDILDISADGSAITPNPGELLWDEVISQNPNVFMTFSGHNHGATNQVRYINDDPDLPVFQQLIDYQMAFQGRNGLMSLAEFDFTNNQLSVTGFSPWVFDKPAEDLNDLDQAMLTGDGDTYTIPFDFEERFAQFDATFEPTGDVPSATADLRTYLAEAFEAPEVAQPEVPQHTQDFYAAPDTAAHWRPEIVDGELLFVDITGNGNDMTLRNPETPGGATYVDGEDDTYLYSSSDSSVLFQPNSRTEYRYFQTGDDAPINSNEFTDSYTVEAFISMTPDTPNNLHVDPRSPR